eukprot:gene20236-biopygen29026
MDHDGHADDLDSSSTSEIIRVARLSALADAHILVDQYKDAINSSRKQLPVSTLLLHQAAVDLIRKDEDEKAALATAALQASLAEARAQAAVPSPLQAMETLMAQMASVIATDSVRHYAQVFLTEVRIAGGLDLKSQLVLFRLGLKPTIECRCRSHPTQYWGPTLRCRAPRLTAGRGPTGGPEGDSKRQRAPSSDFCPVYTEEEKSARSLAIATKRGWKQSNGAPWDMASITAARVKNLCYKPISFAPCLTVPVKYHRWSLRLHYHHPPPIPCISACATSTVHADQDTALFDATLSGVKGKVLIDSGADAVFVSAKFLATEGFATYAGSPVYVRVADGSTVLTTTRADFTLDLGKHRSKVKGAYVLPTLGPTTTALLGRSWMLQSRVCLSFETTRMKTPATLRTPQKTDQNTVELYSSRLESTPYSIPELVAYTLAKTALFDSVVCHSPGLMTNQTLKRWVQRQKQNLTRFEGVVIQLDDSDDAFVLNARTAQIDLDRTPRRYQIVMNCERDFAKAFSTADSVSELRPDTPLVCPLIDPLTSPNSREDTDCPRPNSSKSNSKSRTSSRRDSFIRARVLGDRRSFS